MMSFGVMPFGVMPFGVMPFRVMPFRVMPFRVMPFAVMPFRVMPFGADVHILPTCRQADFSKQELPPFFILFIYCLLVIFE